MTLDKVIKDLKDMRKAGFIDCNIQCFLDQLEKATESIVVDQFIADLYEKYKDNLEYSLWEWMRYEPNREKNKEFYLWLNDASNKPVETLVKMKLFGYTVKKEKLYTVRIIETEQILYKSKAGLKFINNYYAENRNKYEFTKDELDAEGMSYVFGNRAFKVEEAGW